MEKIGEEALSAHDALNDARNTVSVCQHLDMKKGLAEYSELQKRVQSLEHQLERSHMRKAYTTKDEALHDQALTDFWCPICGAKATCSDIVKQNNEKSIGVGRCENGGEFLVRFKYKKLSDGNYGVSRIIYEMNKENRQYWTAKKQYAEELRAKHLQRLDEEESMNEMILS